MAVDVEDNGVHDRGGSRSASDAPTVPSVPSVPSPLRAIAATALEMVAAIVVTGLTAAVVLLLVRHTHLPAFTTSNVSKALTTVAQVVTLAVLALSVFLLRRNGSSRWGKVLSWAGVSAFATVTLAVPLSATKLYLMGVSVDQEFRTEFLTRLTDTAQLHDMTYADLPSYYPAGWFWVGGRLADLFGVPGWEMFKPYAIGSLAVAIGISMVLWSKMIRADRAVIVGAAVGAVLLAYDSPEAYGAIVAVLTPPALVLAWSGLRRGLPTLVPDDTDDTDGHLLVPPQRGAGWAAIIGAGVFLGFSATFYTLYTASAASTFCLMVLIAAALAIRTQMTATGDSLWTLRTWRAAVPMLLRLLVAAVIAVLIALIVWTPYLHASLTQPSEANTALRYLPEQGASLPMPMFDFSLMGALAMLGLLWIVFRARDSVRAQALGISVVAIYLWALLSMAVTEIGTTLLGFRLEAILLLLLGAAGVFGFLDCAAWLLGRVRAHESPAVAERYSWRVVSAVLVVGALGAVAFAQNIPKQLSNEITVAYQDTDGNGHRGDGLPPDDGVFYKRIDRVISSQVSTPPGDTVLLTTDYRFLSYYPYLGFQAITSHYANPLGRYKERAATIERWSHARTADQLIRELDHSPFRAPQAFLLRPTAEGYSLTLTEDVFPNSPNVKTYTVTFPRQVFDDPRFSRTDVGPFAVIVRK